MLNSSKFRKLVLWEPTLCVCSLQRKMSMHPKKTIPWHAPYGESKRYSSNVLEGQLWISIKQQSSSCVWIQDIPWHAPSAVPKQRFLSFENRIRKVSDITIIRYGCPPDVVEDFLKGFVPLLRRLMRSKRS